MCDFDTMIVRLRDCTLGARTISKVNNYRTSSSYLQTKKLPLTAASKCFMIYSLIKNQQTIVVKEQD
jgi:hypothetical protein